MISSIILVVLGLFFVLGLGANVLKDFKMNALSMIILLALVIGLNFIPVISIGLFSFSVGTVLLYVFCFAMFFIKGNMSNRIIAFLISLIFAGIIYGGGMIAQLFGNGYFAQTNIVYAIVIGLMAIIITKNAKYAFISSVFGIMLGSVLLQIGGAINENVGFEYAVIAGALTLVVYEISARLFVAKPNKMSYYMEVGRMKDED